MAINVATFYHIFIPRRSLGIGAGVIGTIRPAKFELYLLTAK